MRDGGPQTVGYSVSPVGDHLLSSVTARSLAASSGSGGGPEPRPGLLLALEPWVMADTAELVTDEDGWTLRSATGCRTAHSEHTIAITDDGAEVLTVRSGS